jgi:DNA-binding NarL/FixJ family response regulator
MNEITIIIAADHPIVRQGLRQTIETEKSFRVLAEATNGREAFDAITKFQPNIVILRQESAPAIHHHRDSFRRQILTATAEPMFQFHAQTAEIVNGGINAQAPE